MEPTARRMFRLVEPIGVITCDGLTLPAEVEHMIELRDLDEMGEAEVLAYAGACHDTAQASYEIPHRPRQAVHLMTPADVFPYAANTTRSRHPQTPRLRRPRPHRLTPGYTWLVSSKERAHADLRAQSGGESVTISDVRTVADPPLPRSGVYQPPNGAPRRWLTHR